MRGKAAEPDGLIPENLKDSSPASAVTLTGILAKIWELDVVSSDWSRSLIIPVYKKGTKILLQQLQRNQFNQ